MTRIPSKSEILQWIADNPGQTAKRDISRAFGLKGAAKVDLKRLLKELETEGRLEKRRKVFRDPDTLPPVSVLSILAPDRDGDLMAQPVEWGGDGPEPKILFIPRDGDPGLGAGDRILARLTAVTGQDYDYEARMIRRIAEAPQRILGIFRTGSGADGGRILPIDKGQEREWRVAPGATHGAKDGELVEAEQAGNRSRLGVSGARVVTRLGDPSGPRAVSLIAIHQHGIPDEFPDDVLAEAENAAPAPLEGREDLRDLPLVTIDPADARDHDDACFARPDDDPKNPGGHIIWVAIADVAHYVRPGSALDREARNRGNSTYFPDRVVPMLPDTLSGDLCSLHEGVDRAVIAVEMRIDAEGTKIGHRFTRAMMRSLASLTYEQVQAARDGTPSDTVLPMIDTIGHLFDAWAALDRARATRQPLNLDLPERTIHLSDEGKVTSVAFKERLDAHRLIEEFMVLANVAAAEELVKRRTPLLFRVHEEPTPEKIESLREVAQASGLVLAKGQVLQTRHLNRLLEQAQGSAVDELINMSTLRAMTQAYYHPQNYGHFGLALKNYAHFTSPIRRYADLIVHRALISAHGWGPDPKADGLSADEAEALEATGKHISTTERRSMVAERDTSDRYLAAFLSERVGTELSGRISGVQRFGAFVRLDETGADGLIPVRTMGSEYFNFDADSQTLTGSDTGVEIALGQRVTVRLAEAVPVTGGLMLDLLEIEGAAMPRGASSRRGRTPGRKPGRGQAKAAKIKRKVKRTRS
ncbi:ribonuclease R [Oceaniovalibus sp. ACAM 378]|uniref:ribonuclease R n=1 Tax=Oceaniovalibus sp. ACAM 378 TaxID=2599923 RepID=UPI0011DC4593|nr:ribonuclease R [Oceaniovalibus sp. ACAM 378]TYB89220.1 ribonuclease R [Oceaniovalibus sp. ACAM 378]